MLKVLAKKPLFLVSNVLFQGQDLSDTQNAQALVSLLKFDLCLDRSNWKSGAKDVNYLALSWRISKDLSLPFLFAGLDKQGNSNTDERIDLLGRFDKLFGVARINSLIADRNFIG